MRELTELTRTLLQHAREILLDATSSSELARLPSGLGSGVRSEISRHGLAAYLVAAPALERKLTTRRHGPGDPESPEGAAEVYAAVDWSLCGRRDPIAPQTLRRLWPTYLGEGTAATDGAFDAGVEWALRPVAGSIALLRRAGGYVAYDYIVSFVRERPEAVDPRDEAWACATDTSDPGQAFAVGSRRVGVRSRRLRNRRIRDRPKPRSPRSGGAGQLQPRARPSPARRGCRNRRGLPRSHPRGAP